MLDEIERQRQGGELSQQQAEQMDALEEDVNNVFSRTREIYNALREQRQHLEQELADSFVFTGFTATATTDIGVTPFDERYVNLGVHAAVLNTLLSGAFLSEAPRWAAVPVAVLVPLLIAVAIRGRRPAAHAGLGSAVIALLVAATAILFAVTGIYVPVLAGLIASVVTLGILTVIALIETERDKRWLHNAFEHYISAEFIDELVHNPSKLDLGGQEQELTAMFTDIRQFTSIAENLPAGDLVSLLNRYLTQMSDLVLDEYGTIDKYEGDAIIAFFGAPIAVPDHPRRACEAALRMKRAEQELNTAIIRDGYSKLPLQTRIGINTGTMLVGNLGTTRRMDYTIMGHQANVASRLEGANKLYGTWILVGEQTYAQVGDGFVFRPLDRVRLSGVQSPIRLYQLITMAGEETPVLKEALEIFADGLAAYERGEFLYAEERFDIVRRYYPDDGPAMLFSERCSLYRENEEVGPDWDGITTLQSK
jgi:adenylate cyclase